MKSVEFLPERVRRQRASRGRMVRMGYLLTACVLSMAALTYARHRRIAAAEAGLTALADRAEAVRRQVAMIAPLERQMADLLIKKRIDEELGSRTDCSALLAELCRMTPPNVALLSLDVKPVDVHASEDGRGRASTHRSARATAAERVRRGTVRRRVQTVLVGVAPSDVDVANFIGQLSASCLFEDVTMGYARTVAFRGRSAREFQASCYLVK